MIRLLLIALVIVGCGPSAARSSAVATAPPTATPPPTPTPRIGDVVDAGNWRYRVMQVDVAKDFVWSRFGNREVAKGVFVLVIVDLTNIGTRNFSINEWDFELRDAKGIKYDPNSFASSAASDGRGHGKLGEQMPPGVTVRTTLVFDVAPGIAGMVLWLEQANVGVRLE